jgi:AcrR family transcriptional regulator
MEEGVKERILKRATELFYVQGVHNTGINQIIDESRVAKASFYHHFPSKDDLISECLLTYGDFLTARVKEIIDSSGSLLEFLSRWAASIERDVSRKKFNGCPIANIGYSTNVSSKKFSELFSKIFESWCSNLDEYFKKCKSAGELPEGTNTMILSRRFTHLYQGAITMWRLTGDIQYIQDLKVLFPRMIDISMGDK